MSAIQRFLRPLRQAAAAFFKHDLAVRREGAEVRFVLEQRAKDKPAKPSRAELAARKHKEELVQMRAELSALLNELPETRQTMRHLVFVEQALAKKGLKALHKVPLDVLQRALEQLEGLVVNWTPVGLASLRSKMAVAIIDREHMDPDAEADAHRTAAVLEHGKAAAQAHVHPAAEAGGDHDRGDGVDAPVPPRTELDRSDEEALAAAYAALGALAQSADEGVHDDAAEAVEMQGELGSRSAKAVQRFQNSTLPQEPAPALRIRELQA